MTLSLYLAIPVFDAVMDTTSNSLVFSSPRAGIKRRMDMSLIIESKGSTIKSTSVAVDCSASTLRFRDKRNMATSDSNGLACSKDKSKATGRLHAAVAFGTLGVKSAAVAISDSGTCLCSSRALALSRKSSTVGVKRTSSNSARVRTGKDRSANTTASVAMGIGKASCGFSRRFTASTVPMKCDRAAGAFGKRRRGFITGRTNIALKCLMSTSKRKGFFLCGRSSSAFIPCARLGVSSAASVVLLTSGKKTGLPSSCRRKRLAMTSRACPC